VPGARVECHVAGVIIIIRPIILLITTIVLVHECPYIECIYCKWPDIECVCCEYPDIECPYSECVAVYVPR
jgi:hypothetical protein